MRKILATAVVAGALLAVAVPAQSAPAVAFSFTGTASLPTFPCVPANCSGSFTGTASGQGENGALVGAPMSATFTYGEPNCELGTASGSGTVAGDPFTFSWTRVGATAVITASYGGHTVAATAAFTTNPAVPAGCVPGGSPGPITATVVGAGAGA